MIDSRYKQLAYSNAILAEVDYPVRGLIKDRNGKLIVYNTPEFDLNIIHKEVKNFDSARYVFQKRRRSFGYCSRNSKREESILL